ncbi:MAG: class I SAM-dependent methyltransferase [Bacteriovoracaceae bacterium]|nr:class I SAM-dependent methyltransferase [Bacteriovoracaceae bacterium]
MKSKNEINHVSDTALWVAAYRALESKKTNALFKDEFAQILIGQLGKGLASYTQGSRYTAWSVVIRTLIIDELISKILENPFSEIDTILNLGAGLDTRPYRMSLPQKINWIEADFPQIIDLKNEKLDRFTPNCQLKRIAIDLTDIDKRKKFLTEISDKSKNILVLTEGVIPYLTNKQAESLACDLYALQNFKLWITEYYSPEILKFLRTPKRLKQMENSPFLFYPDHWFNFFKERGWKEEVTKYFGIETLKYGRTPPTPGWIKELIIKDESIENIAKHQKLIQTYLGYSLYQRNDCTQFISVELTGKD